MVFLCRARLVVPLIAGFVLVGCAKQDGKNIIGKWRTERLQVMSVKLPIGPELDITRTSLAAGGGVSIPIAAITQDGDEVTLDTYSLIGMTFYFVGPDRMYLNLPVVGKIYYRRVDDGAVAAFRAMPSKPVLPAQPALLPQVSMVSQSGQAEPAYVHDYGRALILVKQGDADGAIHSLYDAFKHGFRNM